MLCPSLLVMTSPTEAECKLGSDCPINHLRDVDWEAYVLGHDVRISISMADPGQDN